MRTSRNKWYFQTILVFLYLNGPVRLNLTDLALILCRNDRICFSEKIIYRKTHGSVFKLVLDYTVKNP